MHRSLFSQSFHRGNKLRQEADVHISFGMLHQRTPPSAL
jgi:hypothetical protein